MRGPVVTGTPSIPMPPVPPRDREQAIAYIFEMSSGLAELARAQQLPFLAYLLEMVALASAEGARGKLK